MADTALLFCSFYLGAHLNSLLEPGGMYAHTGDIPLHASIFTGVGLLSLAAMGLYHQHMMREGANGILLRSIGAFALLPVAVSAIYYFLPDRYAWHGILIYTASVAFVASLASRHAFTNLTDLSQLKKRILVYGAGRVASTISTTMRRRTDRRDFTVVGFIEVEGEETRMHTERVIALGQSLPDYVKQTNIHEIVVALDDKRNNLPIDELVTCKMRGVRVTGLADFFEREAGKIPIDSVSPSWLIFCSGFKRCKASWICKRCFDVLFSCLLLLFTWPIMLLTALAIWLEDGFTAPVFFHQERVGRHGQTFQVLKFRSMTVDAEGDGKARWATRNDARVTRVGSFIRKVRIDELPQILNVLRGNMAFIGPRPERPEFVRELGESIPFYDVRHCVKPGITGWAQLRYPYGSSESDARQKLQFDLYYVKNHSLFLDFIILLTTVEVVLFGKGAR